MKPGTFIRRQVPGARLVSRRRSAYATSHRLDDVVVRCAAGSEHRLVLKRSGPHDLLPEADGTRPSFLIDAARESFVYESILDRVDLGTARCYGSRDDGRGGRWLLLEHVRGAALCRIGDRRLWEHAARWLARAHVTLAPFVTAPGTERLIVHDVDFYRLWPARALAFHPAQGAALGRLIRRWDDVVERLVALPRTIIHGELCASNMLVDANTAHVRACAIDWETAAIGPGVADLAALTAGWKGDDLEALVTAYHDELCRQGGQITRNELAKALVDCRLYFCLQWLGWARGWQPPPDQANDWLREALELDEASGS